MHSNNYREFLRTIVLKAFVRCGKSGKDNTMRMQVLIDDIADRNIPENKLRQAFNYHAENSRFVPTFCDIMSIVNAPDLQKNANFLLRFRAQATNSQKRDEMDDDVFTVKKYIGFSRVEEATTKEWPWVEKQAAEYYELLNSKQLRLISNHHADEVKALPSGNGVYIEPKKNRQISNPMGKLEYSELIK